MSSSNRRNQKRTKVLSAPKIQKAQEFPEGRHCAWTFSTADTDGPWPWRVTPERNSGQTGFTEKELVGIINNLSHFEKIPSKNLIGRGKGKKGHLMTLEQISTRNSEPRRRLEEIKSLGWAEGTDGITSFHIGSKSRLWCIGDIKLATDQIIYRIIWWDPDHEVYPVKRKEKSHTRF